MKKKKKVKCFLFFIAKVLTKYLLIVIIEENKQGDNVVPKKNGIVKTYSFDKKTIEQIEFLSITLFLKPTSLLEFIINKEYNKVKNESRKH